jgi:hypothetical protein
LDARRVAVDLVPAGWWRQLVFAQGRPEGTVEVRHGGARAVAIQQDDEPGRPAVAHDVGDRPQGGVLVDQTLRARAGLAEEEDVVS